MERSQLVQKEFSDKLSLNLTDEEANILLEGGSLSVEKLLQNHTLTEVGTALIRWDAIAKTQECNSDETYIWPLGCIPIPKLTNPDFRIPAEWLDHL